MTSLIPVAELMQDSQIFEYSKAANPVESGTTPAIPIQEFPAILYSSGISRVIPLDLSLELRVPYPATSPSLLASFIRINAGERLTTTSNASSEFFYLIRGSGRTETALGAIPWSQGDFVALPGLEATHFAEEDSAFYMVNDSPFFAYLGAQRSHARFEPTIYTGDMVFAELTDAQRDPEAHKRSRISVLLANKNFEQTMTITHTLSEQ